MPMYRKAKGEAASKRDVADTPAPSRTSLAGFRSMTFWKQAAAAALYKREGGLESFDRDRQRQALRRRVDTP